MSAATKLSPATQQYRQLAAAAQPKLDAAKQALAAARDAWSAKSKELAQQMETRTQADAAFEEKLDKVFKQIEALRADIEKSAESLAKNLSDETTALDNLNACIE